MAVALTYDQGKVDAPVVQAKGYDKVAQKNKAIAAEHAIPMVENVSLVSCRLWVSATPSYQSRLRYGRRRSLGAVPQVGRC